MKKIYGEKEKKIGLGESVVLCWEEISDVNQILSVGLIANVSFEQGLL